MEVIWDLHKNSFREEALRENSRNKIRNTKHIQPCPEVLRLRERKKSGSSRRKKWKEESIFKKDIKIAFFVC